MTSQSEPDRHLEKKPILFVDLDGTLIKTDMLYESFIAALRENIFILFYCFIWICRGRAYLKHQLAEHSKIEVSTLPVNRDFLQYLEQKKAQGQTIILATASTKKHAEQIQQHFHPLLKAAIHSSETVNFKGRTKLGHIQRMSPVFDYAGNSKDDLIIFQHAKRCYLVNPETSIKKSAARDPKFKIFDQPNNSFTTWIRQLRIYQWSKNMLLFVPLLVSGDFQLLSSVMITVLGFSCFSALASATYILNDLLDLPSDRRHPIKKKRPLASGEISIPKALVMSFFLVVGAGITSFAIGTAFFLTLLFYLFLTLNYSLWVKRYAAMDVILLAGLYTIRILAGAALIHRTVSFWLLSFSMFIFLSLALVKRCAELKPPDPPEDMRLKGRDYAASDYPVLLAFGSASALLAILLFCFYSQNNALTNQYQDPSLLWLITPALGYWLMRMWVKTHRGEMHHDPIIFSLTDRGSLITIGFITFLTIMAQIL